ncbi:MAG TPA: sugar phosphate isomerase/epimerase, partial [Verrucomicrobiae bacterium]|nr:sugar phosphate isomerase/epimerase [Verrucomicrobiae bacterium]
MKSSNRREFIRQTALTSLAAGILGPALAQQVPEKRKMTIDLVCGSIGISAKQPEAIELASRHGFESVGADAGYLAELSDTQLAELKSTLQEKHLVFGAAGLPVEFRQDEERFEESMRHLPAVAKGLQ